jgi:hypothetical protein
MALFARRPERSKEAHGRRKMGWSCLLGRLLTGSFVVGADSNRAARQRGAFPNHRPPASFRPSASQPAAAATAPRRQG